MCVVPNRREQTLTISSFNSIRLTSVWKNNNPQVCFIELGRELEKCNCHNPNSTTTQLNLNLRLG